MQLAAISDFSSCYALSSVQQSNCIDYSLDDIYSSEYNLKELVTPSQWSVYFGAINEEPQSPCNEESCAVFVALRLGILE